MFNPDDGPVLTPTSVEELQALAIYLWEQPELRSIFKHAGFRGEWSEAEQSQIDRAIEIYARDVLGSGFFPSLEDPAVVKAKSEEYLKDLRDPLLLPLAAVVCRFVAGGKLPSPASEEARAFIEDRHFSRIYLYSGLRTKHASVEENLMVIRDLRDNPAFWEPIKKAGLHGQIDERLWKKTMSPIADQVTVKYGLINRHSIHCVPLLRQIAGGNIKNLDDLEARKFIEKLAFGTRENRNV